MKKNKKLMMALSFSLGAVMLVTTAFADIVSKSGYDQLKEAVKYTSQSLSENLQSFTMQGTVTIKDNDKVLITSHSTEKSDNSKSASESSSYQEYANGEKSTFYSYRDKKGTIWNTSNSDTYYVSEYSKETDIVIFDDPFKEEKVKDAEKIFDALIGNLKDYVVVNERSDGSKELSGTLNEAQIPAVLNAISSFALKYSFSDKMMGNQQQVPIPQILDDVFIKNVTGKAVVNKDGILESIFASGIVSGKDKNGVSHDLTLEVLGRIYDINSTVVTKPDLTGKKVEKREAYMAGDKTIHQKFVGKYKNDIVIEKDNSYVKIGERIVVIANIDDKHVSGRYYEQYKDEYAEYAKDNREFTFDAEIKSQNSATFNYPNAHRSRQSGSIHFDEMLGRMYFNVDLQVSEKPYTFVDSIFNRVYED